VPWPYRFGEQVKDARVVIEALAGKQVTAVGVSDGANVIVKLACDYPGLIHKLVLAGAGPGYSCIGTPFEASTTWGETQIEMLDREGIEGLAAAVVREIFTEPGTEDVARAYRQQLSRIGRDTWLNFLDPGPDLEIGPILADVSVPTLVMHGTEDRSVPVERGRYIAARIPGASLYLFEGKGHLPIFTATSEYCDVLRRFVRSGEVPQRPGSF